MRGDFGWLGVRRGTFDLRVERGRRFRVAAGLQVKAVFGQASVDRVFGFGRRARSSEAGGEEGLPFRCVDPAVAEDRAAGLGGAGRVALKVFDEAVKALEVVAAGFRA